MFSLGFGVVCLYYFMFGCGYGRERSGEEN